MRQKKRWMALGLAAMMTTTAAPMPAMAEMEILSSGSEAAAETAAESTAAAAAETETTAATADESTAAETLGDGQVEAAANAVDQPNDLLIETPSEENVNAAFETVLEPNVEQLSDELASTEALETTEVGEGETPAATSGKCGENVTWELDAQGVLTLKGSGPTYERNWYKEDSEEGRCIVRFAYVEGDDVINVPEPGWDAVQVKEVRVEPGITRIGETLFMGCKNLTKVSLPDSVVEIRNYAFAGCSNLTDIALPKNLERIGSVAFRKVPLKKLELPSTVTWMGNHVFYECKSLEEVVIPESLTSLSEGAFGECTSLHTVKLPATLKQIGESTFSGCESLKNIDLPDSVVEIGRAAFIGCESLERIRLSENLPDINTYAFYQSGLREVEIPDSVVVIENNAFEGCSQLEKVTFGSGLRKINFHAFWDCNSLKTLLFKGNAPRLSERTFRRKSSEPISAVYPRDNDSWTQKLLKGYGTSITWEMPALPELTAPEVKLANTNKGIRLSWNPVENARGYEVYRKLSTDKSYTKIATMEYTSTTSYLDAGTRSGKVYMYAVKAVYNSEHKSAYIRQAIRSLSTPTITRAVRGKTGVSLRWKAVSGAKGYYVYRKAGNGKYVRIATRNKVGAVTFKDTKAKRGQTYTYAVRAFNGKSMSAFVGKTVK